MTFYKTDNQCCCPTVAVDGEYAIGDPVYLIPHDKESGNDWMEVCKVYISAGKGIARWTPYHFNFNGVDFECVDTDGDGFYGPGVAVDTGGLARCRLSDLKKAFPTLKLISFD